MNQCRLDHAQLLSQLKELVTDLFRPEIDEPEQLSDHGSLLGDNAGLDAGDALELSICIEEKFGVIIRRGEQAFRAFASFASLAAFILACSQPERVLAAAARIVGPVLPVLLPA